MQPSHTLTSIELLPNNTVLIVFTPEWEQEHINDLGKTVLDCFKSIQQGEWVNGADREYIRCQWQGYHIILNFECYSQSCWFECEDETDNQSMPQIYAQLKQYFLLSH